MAEKNAERLGWVDVLRGMAIFFIRVGHYGDAAGPLYPFVYVFQVQLFFFISGLFAGRSLPLAAPQALKKFAKRILLPYLILSAVNVVFFTFYNGLGLRGMAELALNCLAARRNACYVSTLWFFPCLFIVTALYYFLARLIKNRYALVAVCFALSMAMRLIKEEPQWLFSADSAVLYIFYYALGDFVMPYIRAFSFGALTGPRKALFTATAALAAGFAAIWYAGPQRFYAFIGAAPGLVAVKFINVFAALALIYFFLLAAALLRRASPLAALGRYTFIFAGTELLSIVVFTRVLGILGLEIPANGPPGVLITCVCTFVFSYFLLARPLALLLPGVFGVKGANATASDKRV